MLTAVLVLQAFILLLIIVLSIVGWRKLTLDQQTLTEQLKLTEKLAEDQQKLTETSQKLTERLTEDQQQVTEQLTETSQKLTQVLSIQLYDRGKLTEDQQKLTETSEKITEQLTEKRVSVSYEPIISHKDKLFRNEVVASYRMQLHYDGLPIGEPTEKIVYSANKVDKEAVQKALTGALQTLQIALEASGTPFRVLNTVDDVIKNLWKK